MLTGCSKGGLEAHRLYLGRSPSFATLPPHGLSIPYLDHLFLLG